MFYYISLKIKLFLRHFQLTHKPDPEFCLYLKNMYLIHILPRYLAGYLSKVIRIFKYFCLKLRCSADRFSLTELVQEQISPTIVIFAITII